MSRATNSTKRLLQHGMSVRDPAVDTAAWVTDKAGWVLKPRGRALTQILQGAGLEAVGRHACSAGTCLLASGLRMV